MMRRGITLGLAAALLATALGGASALAEDRLPTGVERERVDVRIVTDVRAVTPGERVRVGVHFALHPEWHVYWKVPGDSGLPTEITFDSPSGLHFGPLQFATPQRFVDRIGSVTFGYEDEVLIFSEVELPDDLEAGGSVRLVADTSWLVCKVNCIQGSAKLGLTLPVEAGAVEDRRAPEHALFEHFAARIPAPEAPPGLELTHRVRPDGVRSGEDFSVEIMLADAEGAPLAFVDGPAGSIVYAPASGLRVRSVDEADPAPPGDHTLGIVLGGRTSHTATQQGDAIDVVVHVLRGGEPVAFEARLAVPRVEGVAEGSDAPAVVPLLDDEARDFVSACEHAGIATAGGGSGLASLWLALLAAFLGGIILNAMPCVLPVLSIKVMSLVEQADSDRRTIFRHGLIYTAGVLVSFGVLAALMVILQASSWAFQLQDPVFVAVFVAILFAFALSLFGVFEVRLPGMSTLDRTVHGSHGYMSSFNYGVFAVLLGTPCTAPFLGPAMTYAFAQPPVTLTLLLLTVGLGLAFPFLVLAAFPQWRRLVPKPGPWLETFKKAMGFLLIGTAVFFVRTLAAQVSVGAFVDYLIFLSLLALALWIYGNWGNPIRPRGARLISATLAVGIIAVSAVTIVSTERPPPPAGTTVIGGITWYDFDQIDVREEALGGRTVFIDFTATWCATCKVNEAVAIYRRQTRAAFEELDVMAVKADFTVFKPEIAAWLEKFQEPSVPLYVVLPAGRPDDAIKLPTLLTQADVLAAVCTAGPSQVRTAAIP